MAAAEGFRLNSGSLIAYAGKLPNVPSSVFVAPGAKIIGDVVIGEESSVWFNAVIRGDVNWIRVGARTNVQDNCVLHVTHETCPLTVGSDVTVGHQAVLHGCTIHDASLIGMGSVILDRAVVGRNALVAAGSLVVEGFEVPEGALVAGSPARVRRMLTPEERSGLEMSARRYMAYAARYRT